MNESLPSSAWNEISAASFPTGDVPPGTAPVPPQKDCVGAYSCIETILPYGAEPVPGGVNFRFFSRNARVMRILFYDSAEAIQPVRVVTLAPETHRWGDVWSTFIPGCGVGTLYHIQADGPFVPEQGMRFNGKARLIDPFAKALAGNYLFTENGVLVPPKCVVMDDHFDWRGDRHLRYRLADTVIYETHVRGLTQSPTSDCEHPGTYRGVIEKIPYLKSLGISAVELMPTHEFMESDPFTKPGEAPRVNYWGYDPVAFFAPFRGYASDPAPGAQVHEFKEMVLALHQAGIEVILDVVFNHTAEGNEFGPTLSFKGLENSVYYILDRDRSCYANYSGCGNTVNGNHPIVRELIFNCLRYWVHNFHVDGFRFDLASILSRDRHGNLMTNPPIVEMIAEDPLLADTKIIAEAWDAAGAYQVGHFSGMRWAEWNGRYRDDVRRYWRGDSFMTNLLATRVAGSSDLYKPGGRAPYHSINFITSHDGFTLNDLVSYNSKHNEQNGEGNRDGDNNGFSYNNGTEGPSADAGIEKARERQIKNFLATLLFSQGVPMILMGDECRRTQFGNNNAYCQNNEISWFDWTLLEKYPQLVRFVSALIGFRRSEPTLRRQHFLSGEPATRNSRFRDVTWYRFDGKPFNWTDASTSTLVCMLAALTEEERRKQNLNAAAVPGISVNSGASGTSGTSGISGVPEFRSHHILAVYHNEPEAVMFRFPPEIADLPWRLFVDTASVSPSDVYPEQNGPLADTSATVLIPPHTFRCYLAPCGTTSVGEKIPLK